MRQSSAFRLAARIGTAILVMGVMSCGNQEPSSGPSMARSSGGGAKGPTVKSTSPSSGARNTTLTVQVLGSGYGPGSTAVWALNGDTAFATTKVHTNSTTYLSSTELLADITIGGDTPLDLFDVVVVTAAGKKGIGIELFEVIPQVTFLPDFGGGSRATDVNEAGVVVGGGGDAPGTLWRPLRWTSSGGAWIVSVLPGAGNGGAEGINDAGTIVGTLEGNARVWTANGGTADLGPGVAFDINESETIAGVVETPSGRRAAVWTQLAPGTWGAPRELPALPGAVSVSGLVSQALGINDANTVVGDAWDESGMERAVKWTLQNGQWLGPTVIDTTSGGYVWDINENGDAAGGFCSTPTPPPCGLFDAVLWNAGGTAQVLPTLGAWATALDINNLKEIVGSSIPLTRSGKSGTRVPVYWFGGVLRKLPAPGGMIDDGEAAAITEGGVIAGSGQTGGRMRAILWRLRP